jgi:hypothetical protein
MDENNSKKKVGKKAEPTSEELEFIYKCFTRKLSNSEVLEEMKSEEFEFRTTGFIKRTRRQYDAAKKVIEKKLEGSYDKDPERFKRHWRRLSERAQELLDTLKTFSPYQESCTSTDFAVDYGDFDLDSLLTDFRSECLLSHIKAEMPELNDLSEWGDLIIDRINNKLLRVLGHWAEQKQFPGKCEVCKKWE